MKQRILIFLIGLMASVTGWSQSVGNQKRFLIITLERQRNWDMHGIERCYWIVGVDSKNSEMHPPYLHGFSKTS